VLEAARSLRTSASRGGATRFATDRLAARATLVEEVEEPNQAALSRPRRNDELRSEL